MPRLTIGVSDYVFQRLIFLGEIYGRPKSSIAGQLVADWVLENDSAIDLAIQNAARQNGVSEEEIMKRWLLDGDRKYTEEG